MHRVVFTNPVHVGVLPDRLVNKSVVLLNPGSTNMLDGPNMLDGTMLASKATTLYGGAAVPLTPLQLPVQVVALPDIILPMPVPPTMSPELVPLGFCAPPAL